MNGRANLRREEEENVNEGVTPQGLKYDQALQGNQISVVPPYMTNEEIMKTFYPYANL